MHLNVLINSPNKDIIDSINSQSFKDVKAIINSTNQNPIEFYNQNIAQLAKSDSEILTFLNVGESYKDPDTLQRFIDVFVQRPKIKFAYSDLLLIQNDIEITGYNPPFYMGCGPRFVESPIFIRLLPSINVVFKKNYSELFKDMSELLGHHIPSPELIKYVS